MGLLVSLQKTKTTKFGTFIFRNTFYSFYFSLNILFQSVNCSSYYVMQIMQVVKKNHLDFTSNINNQKHYSNLKSIYLIWGIFCWPHDQEAVHRNVSFYCSKMLRNVLFYLTIKGIDGSMKNLKHSWNHSIYTKVLWENQKCFFCGIAAKTVIFLRVHFFSL